MYFWLFWFSHFHKHIFHYKHAIFKETYLSSIIQKHFQLSSIPQLIFFPNHILSRKRKFCFAGRVQSNLKTLKFASYCKIVKIYKFVLSFSSNMFWKCNLLFLIGLECNPSKTLKFLFTTLSWKFFCKTHRWNFEAYLT